MLILIAGPYASGTGGDPDLMAQNLKRLEEAAWPIFRAGHVPMIGGVGRSACALQRRRERPD